MIKNVIPYKTNMEVVKKNLDPANLSSWQQELQELLTENLYQTPAKATEYKAGWSQVLQDQMILDVNGMVLMKFTEWKKSVPTPVINNVIAERLQGKKLSRMERNLMVEDIKLELMPAAFPKITHTYCWMDANDDMFYVDTSSAAVADRVTTYLRATLNELPLEKMKGHKNLHVLLQTFDATLSQTGVLELGASCEFIDAEDGKVSFSKYNLAAGEVMELADTDTHCSKIGLVFDEKVGFVLCDNGSLNKLQFLGTLDYSPESKEDRLTGEFVMEASEIQRMVRAIGEL